MMTRHHTVRRFKQRIELGDVIASPSGEFVLHADYERLQKALETLSSSSWDAEDVRIFALETVSEVRS